MKTLGEVVFGFFSIIRNKKSRGSALLSTFIWVPFYFYSFLIFVFFFFLCHSSKAIRPPCWTVRDAFLLQVHLSIMKVNSFFPIARLWKAWWKLDLQILIPCLLLTECNSHTCLNMFIFINTKMFFFLMYCSVKTLLSNRISLYNVQ